MEFPLYVYIVCINVVIIVIVAVLYSIALYLTPLKKKAFHKMGHAWQYIGVHEQ